jgi:hypothetical protein
MLAFEKGTLLKHNEECKVDYTYASILGGLGALASTPAISGHHTLQGCQMSDCPSKLSGCSDSPSNTSSPGPDISYASAVDAATETAKAGNFAKSL